MSSDFVSFSVRGGWPIVEVRCCFCDRNILSVNVFGVRCSADGKLEKCCDNEVCIKKFLEQKYASHI